MFRSSAFNQDISGGHHRVEACTRYSTPGPTGPDGRPVQSVAACHMFNTRRPSTRTSAGAWTTTCPGRCVPNTRRSASCGVTRKNEFDECEAIGDDDDYDFDFDDDDDDDDYDDDDDCGWGSLCNDAATTRSAALAALVIGAALN